MRWTIDLPRPFLSLAPDDSIIAWKGAEKFWNSFGFFFGRFDDLALNLFTMFNFRNVFAMLGKAGLEPVNENEKAECLSRASQDNQA